MYLEAVLHCEKGLKRRGAAEQEESRRRSLFQSFQKGSKGVLSLEETKGLAKSLLKDSKAKVSDKALQRIVRGAVAEELSGLSFEDFHLLATSVGIFRELERDTNRRLAREAKQKLQSTLQSHFVTVE